MSTEIPLEELLVNISNRPDYREAPRDAVRDFLMFAQQDRLDSHGTRFAWEYFYRGWKARGPTLDEEE